uniref:Putative tick defensin n=1 Tax=Rhipicephalus pulchellus TaxID=72859 RepID=L7MCJ3_RHIPC
MFAAHSAFLLIVAITIAMINTSSTSTWAVSGTCKTPGVPCRYPSNSTCRGVCTCRGYYNTYGFEYICMDPDYRGPNVMTYY